MRTHVIITVIVLVIVPTALLSFMASRALKSQDVLLDRRLESAAADVLQQIADGVAERLGQVQEEVVIHVDSGDDEIWSPHRLVRVAADLHRAHPVLGRLFVYDSDRGLVYPPILSVSGVRYGQEPSAGQLLASGNELQHIKQNYAAAIEAYQKVRARADLPAPIDWEARLRIAHCYRELGDLRSAIEILQARDGRMSGQAYLEARNEEGYLYSLTVLKEISGLLAAVGDFTAAAENELVLFDALIRYYPDLVANQRSSLLGHVRQWTRRIIDWEGSGDDSIAAARTMTEIRGECERLHTLLHEWEENRRFTTAEREQLQATVAEALPVPAGGGWIQSGDDGYYSISSLPTREGRAVGFSIRNKQAVSLLADVARDIAAPRDFSVYTTRGWLHASTVAPVEAPSGDEALSSLSSGLPFAVRTLYAIPGNQDELQARRKLQRQLHSWGIFVLVFGIGIGVLMLFLQVREELQQAKARSEFVAGISHDLRTPLASMRMLSESLFYGSVKSEEKRKTFLKTIVQECDRLTHMIDRALFFVRLGHNALVYNRSEIEVGALLVDAVEVFRSRVPEGRAEVELDIEPGFCNARVDGDAIEQVILNLLDNALKYSPPAAHIHVSLRRVDGTLRLAVADKGIGMTKAQARRVFKKYYRARSTASKAKGVGLGLALCRHVIRSHGGRIGVESQPGEGSTFTVVLPLIKDGPGVDAA